MIVINHGTSRINEYACGCINNITKGIMNALLLIIATLCISNVANAQCPETQPGEEPWIDGMTGCFEGAQVGQQVFANFCYRCIEDPETGKCRIEIYIKNICVGPAPFPGSLDEGVGHDTSWYFQRLKDDLAWAAATGAPPFHNIKDCGCNPTVPPCPEGGKIIVVGHPKCVTRLYIQDRGVYFIKECGNGDECRTEYCVCNEGGQVVYLHENCDNHYSNTQGHETVCIDCGNYQSGESLPPDNYDLNGNGIIEPDEKNLIGIVYSAPRSVCE